MPLLNDQLRLTSAYIQIVTLALLINLQWLPEWLHWLRRPSQLDTAGSAD